MRYDGIPHNNGICISGIYSITNKVNGKMYIGLSVDMYDRWRTHARLGGKINKPLYNAIEKYGIDNFDFEILEECDDRYSLPELEIKYVAQFNTTVPNGYNLTVGGEGVVPATDNQRKAASERMLSCWQNEEYREAQIASLNTESHKQRQAEDSRARWKDPAYKEKVRQSLLLALHTDSYKEKASATHKALWATEEHRLKMAACRPAWTEEKSKAKSEKSKAMWQDPVFRETQVAKIRLAASQRSAQDKRKATMNTPEVKAKCSASQKAQWQKPETIIKMHFRKLTCGVVPSFEVGWERAVTKGVDPSVWYDWAINYYASKYPSSSSSLETNLEDS